MLLSIVVPVYNGEVYIENCINNILNQEYNDIEIIIVNDGSVDNTKTICERLKANNKNIKLINLNNGGVSRARNIGITNSRGKYITFLDCDDKIERNMYKNLIDNIQKYETDLAICSYISEYDTHKEKNILNLKKEVITKEEINDTLIYRMISRIDKNNKEQNIIGGNICKCIFDKKKIVDKKITFNEDIKCGEDFLFLLEYLLNSKKIYVTDECYYLYNRKTNLNLSTTQKYMPDLAKDLMFVDDYILDSIGKENLEYTKSWALRKVTNTYTLIVNECNQDLNKGVINVIKEFKIIKKKNKFDKHLEILNKNELYGLKKIVIFCIKYNLYYLILIYFSYISKFKMIKNRR